jgi:hypothetical protein
LSSNESRSFRDWRFSLSIYPISRAQIAVDESFGLISPVAGAPFFPRSHPVGLNNCSTSAARKRLAGIKPLNTSAALVSIDSGDDCWLDDKAWKRENRFADVAGLPGGGILATLVPFDRR